MAGPSTAGHEYDADLLNEAPKLDKKRIQEGYSTDLLNKPAEPRKSTPTPASIPIKPQTPNADLERNSHALDPPTKPQPFFKTRKGRILLAAVVLAAIIAAVVGGVVGSRKSKKSDSVDGAGDTDDSDPETNDASGAGRPGPPVTTVSQIVSEVVVPTQVVTTGADGAPVTITTEVRSSFTTLASVTFGGPFPTSSTRAGDFPPPVTGTATVTGTGGGQDSGATTGPIFGPAPSQTPAPTGTIPGEETGQQEAETAAPIGRARR